MVQVLLILIIFSALLLLIFYREKCLVYKRYVASAALRIFEWKGLFLFLQGQAFWLFFCSVVGSAEISLGSLCSLAVVSINIPHPKYIPLHALTCSSKPQQVEIALRPI